MSIVKSDVAAILARIQLSAVNVTKSQNRLPTEQRHTYHSHTFLEDTKSSRVSCAHHGVHRCLRRA